MYRACRGFAEVREALGGPRRPPLGGTAKRRPSAKRVLKWIAIAAGGWILISFLAFAVSAQIQAFKLSGEAKEALHGNPFMLASAQTILVLGTDARPPDTKELGENGASAAPSQECFEQQAHGDAPHGKCSVGQFRADTLMLIRAGGGTFRKLSIPRDSYAEIPGQKRRKSMPPSPLAAPPCRSRRSNSSSGSRLTMSRSSISPGLKN